MHRRSFLTYVTGAAAGIALGGCTNAFDDALAPQNDLEPAPTRGPTAVPTLTPGPVAVRPEAGSALSGPPLLVIVHMAGGNDGLNTIIPTNVGRYHDLRPDLGIDPASALFFSGNDEAGFHPALAPLGDLWDAGQLACVHSIGIPGASRSHFVASDAWWSGTPTPSTTGWIGRWLETRWLETQSGLDSSMPNPLSAVSLGRGPALFSAPTHPSTSVLNVAQFGFLTPRSMDEVAVSDAYLKMTMDQSPDPLIAQIQQAIQSASTATELFAGLDLTGAGDSAGFAGTDSFTELLQVAAALVVADPAVQVINVGVNGFDTHATQERLQAELLGDLATGIASFFATAEAEGFADRTVLMTTSEFGRRAAENGSTGTDHGKGGVQFVCGPRVSTSTVTGLPDLSSLDDGDVPIEFDTRSLYAEALDWLGGPTDEVLGEAFPRLGLLNG